MSLTHNSVNLRRGYKSEEFQVTSKAQVRDAVQLLVDAPNYVRIINEMTQIIENWEAHPMAYSGRLMPLNALLEVGLANRSAFEALIQLAEKKRRLVPKLKRVDYQRDLMRERRAREKRALELAELTRGPMAREQAAQYLRETRERWNDAKRQHVQAKGKLDWSGRNEATREFWEMIDAQLDLNIRDARRKRARLPA